MLIAHQNVNAFNSCIIYFQFQLLVCVEFLKKNQYHRKIDALI